MLPAAGPPRPAMQPADGTLPAPRPSSPDGHGAGQVTGITSVLLVSQTTCVTANRRIPPVIVEDPAYAEFLVPRGVPDPPRKPYPPRYFPAESRRAGSGVTATSLATAVGKGPGRLGTVRAAGSVAAATELARRRAGSSTRPWPCSTDCSPRAPLRRCRLSQGQLRRGPAGPGVLVEPPLSKSAAYRLSRIRASRTTGRR